MSFTPLNIKNHEFAKAVRGYDKEEVKAYLLNLSEDYERMLEEKEKLAKQVEELRAKNENYSKMEASLRSTLLNAQESSQRSIEEAKEKTGAMIKEASEKADRIVSDARKKAESLINEVESLKEERRLYISKLKAMVVSQADLLDISFSEPEPEKEVKKEDDNKKVNNKKDDDINVDDILEKLL